MKWIGSFDARDHPGHSCHPGSPALPALRISPWQVHWTLASMGAFMLSVMAQVLGLPEAPLLDDPAQFVACMSRVGKSVHT